MRMAGHRAFDVSHGATPPSLTHDAANGVRLHGAVPGEVPRPQGRQVVAGGQGGTRGLQGKEREIEREREG